MEDISKKIGIRIRQARRNKKMRLKDVSEMADLSIGAISEIERGLGNPSVRTMHKLSEVLDLPISYFFFTDEMISIYPLEGRHAPELELFQKQIRHYTGGELDIKFTSNYPLVTDKSIFKKIQDGELFMAIVNTNSLWFFMPELLVFSFPFLFKDWSHVRRALDGEFGSSLEKRFLERGIRLLGWWRGGVRNLYHNIHPVHHVDNLRGMRIRVPEDPILVSLYRTYNAYPVVIPWEETKEALVSGIIDGVDSNLNSGWTAGHHNYVRYVCCTNAIYGVLAFLVSEPWWRTLPPYIQESIKKAELEARQIHWNIEGGYKGRSIQRWEESGKEIIYPQIDSFNEKAREIYPLYNRFVWPEVIGLIDRS